MPLAKSNWEVARTPLYGITTLRGNTTKDQRYVNMFIERLENQDAGAARFFATKRPGYSVYSTVTAAAGRGLYSWNGSLYSVVGDKIYKNGVALAVTLTTTTGSVSFMETSGIASIQRLAVNVGGELYTIKTDDTVTKVSSVDADYPVTNNLGMVEFFDGYMIVATSDGKIWNSDNEDPNSWLATAFITAQKYPDRLVGIARNSDVLLAFGEWTTEQFYDGGIASPSSFLSRLDQGTLQVGCASKDSIVHQENYTIWVGASRTGGYTVQKLDGVAGLEKISNDSIEKMLNLEETDIVNSYAFPLRIAGHFYYILTLTRANRTFVYDIDEGRWTEMQSGSSGRFVGVAAEQHNYVPVFLHESNGIIYQFDPELYQDAGSSITCVLQTAPVDRDSQKNKTCKRVEIYGDEQTSSCPVTIEYSDDNYKTFSTPRTVDMQYRSMLTGLGKYRRRAWRFTHTANTPLRLEGFEEEFQEGSF